MSDQIYIGNFAKGLKLDVEPFNIDNDSFPTLYNAYSWRGRAKKKRGTSFLGRLQRQVQSVSVPLSWQYGSIPLTLTIFANLLGFLGLSPTAILISGISNATQAVVIIIGSTFQAGQVVNISHVGGMTIGGYYTIISTGVNTITIDFDSTLAGAYTPATGLALLAGGPSITPGTINLTVGADLFTEPDTPNGTLLKNGNPDTSTINYATGIAFLSTSGASATGTFSYFPDLPVLGLEDFVSNELNSKFPLLIAFDTTYAYQINDAGTPVFFYGINYYKATNNPLIWSNTDSNQFWSTNYQSAFWVTNNKPGFHFVNGTYISGSGTTDITFNFKNNGVNFATLIPGDILWFNEWPSPSTINGNKNIDTNGVVLTVLGGGDYIVRFPIVETVIGTGIAQLLTNSIPGQDGIRWYDGDPTSGTGLPVINTLGWVNFSPPLTALQVGINDQIPATYYLVGALAILPFKDRLLFFGPQIQSSTGPVIQKPMQDTVLWSWNGTPYYNSLVPTNTTNSETFDARSYYVDQTGFGGFLPAGIAQPIVTVMNNEDVILIGFGGSGKKTRFVYTGNDLQPFLFYLINSELPSCSTFSGVVLDRGGIDIGQYGITLTTQQSCERVDLDIPDQIFEIQTLNNGQNRVNAVRNFFREWIYFSYPTGDGAGEGSWVYPSQSLLFNYRDNTWAIIRENFTHHGIYRKSTHYTWLTLPFNSWETWREPWNAGSSQALFPNVIGGNPQGFVLNKDTEGVSESQSGSIDALQDDGMGNTQVTSVNHCVNDQSEDQGTMGDYLYFSMAIGTTTINTKIGLVIEIIDADNFVVDIPYDGGTYLGLGVYTRLIQPLIQTKQFPFYWNEGRQVRIGPQKYLLDYTDTGQVTLNIYLSQDPDTVYNYGNIVPAINVLNNSLVYSQILYTCPESTNLGLSPANITPANINLQMPTAFGQSQIWHRMNTSLIGDSFQVGITLNDAQMRNINLVTNEIVLHGMQFDVYRGPLLC